MASRAKQNSRDDDEGQAFLLALGQSVRSARAARGMTRKILARDSGVSERYLAQLEAGRGNVSVLLLLKVAAAMAMSIESLLGGSAGSSTIRREAEEWLHRIDEAMLPETVDILRQRAHITATKGRARRIALIGLRGAGKSTLGRAFADCEGIPFVELNRIIEAEYGGSLDDLFSLAGQPAYRRYEQRCLDRVLSEYDSVIIATGGGIVTNAAAFNALLGRTHTIWVQASPEEHMARVVAQGDLRPMADNREAMADLQQILSARETSYGQAQAQLNTSGRTIEQSVADLVSLADELLQNSPVQRKHAI